MTAGALNRLQRLRLSLDQLEAGLLDRAQAPPMDWAGIGAVVGITAADAKQRYQHMHARRLAGVNSSGTFPARDQQ